MPDYPARADLNIEDSWRVAQGTYEGHSLILRYRDGVAALAGHPDYGHHVGVVITFAHPQPNGYPGRDEIAVLNHFEESLGVLEENNESILVAVLTTNGMREYVLYTADPVGAAARYAAVEVPPSYQVEMLARADPEWESFAFLMALISARE